jgi:hypothetical protein
LCASNAWAAAYRKVMVLLIAEHDNGTVIKVVVHVGSRAFWELGGRAELENERRNWKRWWKTEGENQQK